MDHIHTLEETIVEEEDQGPLLLHLQGGRGRGRGRTLSLTSSVNSRPSSAWRTTNSNRPRCTSTSQSRVREGTVVVVRDGEISIVPACEEEEEEKLQLKIGSGGQGDGIHPFSDGHGRTLAEPKPFNWSKYCQIDGIALCKLISFWLSCIWATLTSALAIHLLKSPNDKIAPGHTPSFKPIHYSSSSPISSLGRTIELDGIHYFVPGKPKHILSLHTPPQSPLWHQHSLDLFPMTVVESTESIFSDKHLARALDDYGTRDDVWSPAFSSNLVLHYAGKATTAILDDQFNHKHSMAGLSGSNVGAGALFLHGYSSIVNSGGLKLRRLSSDEALPPGPYFAHMHSGQLMLYEAWRLYNDDYRAFQYGTIPHHKDDSSYSVLSASLSSSDGTATIGVPSRLYYKKTDDKPLAGVRVSVKDLFDLKGTKTGNGSRAWIKISTPAVKNAVAVQRLIDLGAVIVGKTRLSQFAIGQYGTADNVDYGVPFNVRGDGYQEPSSSSSGSGASAGAYSWVDLALGSDTGGSVRAPAGMNGVYGNRPSQGAIDLTGALPLSTHMDTAALLSYDAKNFAKYAKAYYYHGRASGIVRSSFLATSSKRKVNAAAAAAKSFPKRLIYLTNPQNILMDEDTASREPGFFPPMNELAIPVYEKFVRQLEQFLDTKREIVDFYAKYKRRFGVYPAEHVGAAWSLLTAYDSWNLVGKPFEERYKALHGGDRPFVDPPTRKQWTYGQTVSETDVKMYLERKDHFRDFIKEELLNDDNEEGEEAGSSNALMIFPLVDGRPSYVSDYHMEGGHAFKGFNKYSISQLGQVPEIVIPIGEVPYHSKITQTTKYLPVSISILAAEGCDFMLYDLIEALADAGIIRSTTPGTSRTFSF